MHEQSSHQPPMKVEQNEKSCNGTSNSCPPVVQVQKQYISNEAITVREPWHPRNHLP